MLDNFVKIGEYREPNTNSEYKEYIGRTKSKVQSCVYTLSVNGALKYIGKTKRGFSRPLSYNKNDVMKNQRDGILEETTAGNIVEVHAFITDGFSVNVNGVNVAVDVCEDYEQELIRIYNPPWNNGKE